LWIYLVKKEALIGVAGRSDGEFPDMIRQQDSQSTPPVSRSPPGTRPKRIKVSELLQGEREVILEHDSQDYRLRITANGKLILTK
jgi:hemin uptake protein HemP